MKKERIVPEEQAGTEKMKKKKPLGFIFILLLLILALAGGTAYYFYERSKPAQALEEFLTSVKKMDFAKMESMLQSNDLSALDNADVRNTVYENFFLSINDKMTFRITKTRFNFQEGSAEVTARIRYIDGSEIYKETITEFLRQIVSTTFSGGSLTEQETQERLASILSEKEASLEEQFTETDIVYPMIRVNGEWKVTVLDDETVKVMSANFKSVEDEIRQTLDDQAEDSASSDGSTAQAPVENTGTIDLTTDRFSIHYTRNVVSTDFGGEPCILVYYDYTNNGTSASSAMVDVKLSAYQNGSALEPGIPAASDDAVDAFMKEIQPGESINVCQVFSLQDKSPVTLQASDTFGLDSGAVASQILNIQ